MLPLIKIEKKIKQQQQQQQHQGEKMKNHEIVTYSHRKINVSSTLQVYILHHISFIIQFIDYEFLYIPLGLVHSQ